MISHEYRSIFVHQRKCAGSSIMRTFNVAFGTLEWDFMKEGVLSPEHATAPAGYFRFAVVRNPWDRFVSGWKYCASTRERTLKEVLADLPRQGHDYRHVTRPQHAILFDDPGELIVDFLIRFEQLQEGFDAVCDRIGKPRCPLSHRNRGSRGHYRDYFDAESRRMFLRHFARDVEIFGYEY
ncbi:MAG TPA: sulfotransferase family 2 domain-containing protein [Thermoanaerobaculia bacterium]